MKKSFISGRSFFRSCIIYSATLLVLFLSSSFSTITEETSRADAAFQIPYINITSTGMYDVPAVGGEYITFTFNLGQFPSSKIPVFYNSDSFIDDLNSSIANSGDLNFTVESIEQSEYDDMAGYMTIYVGSNISPDGYEYVVSITGALGGRITLNQASY